MSPVQRKCFAVSAAVHGLLVVVLILAPAFFVPDKKPPEAPLLDIIPPDVIDGVLFGGNQAPVTPPPPPPPVPVVQPPPVAPPTLTPPPPKPEVRPTPPPPEPEPVRRPDPPKPQVKPVIPKLEPEPKHEPKPKKPEVKVDLTTKTVKVDQARAENKRKAEAEDKAQKEREKELDRLAKLADAQASKLNQTFSSLRKNLSSETSVHIPGPGASAFANYAQVVKSIYDRNWVFRDDIADLRSTVDATIVIASDGTVLSARITRSSSNAALNTSVREVLLRVKHIQPFPAGATEKQRTFELNFNPASKAFL